MPYAEDIVTTGYDEYARYPLETLVDYGGDCEDTSILMAALLKAMGYDAVLLYFSGDPGHVAVGVAGQFSGSYFDYQGAKYYYLETTGSGWEIGDIPPEYEHKSANIYQIIPVPILNHEWEASIKGNTLTATVTVSNLGTAPASDAYILTGFDAGDGKTLWNHQESEHFNLQPDYNLTITLQLRIPDGKHTRLIMQIVYDGYAVDESRSEWFDT